MSKVNMKISIPKAGNKTPSPNKRGRTTS